MHNFNVLIYNTATCFGTHWSVIRERSCTKAITIPYYHLQYIKMWCDHQCTFYRGEYNNNYYYYCYYYYCYFYNIY